MTVSELIERLKTFPQDANVSVYEETALHTEPVTELQFDAEIREVILLS